MISACRLMSPGFAQEKTGAIPDAIKTYESVLHFVGSDILSSASLQFKTWSEALLARLCLLLDLSHPSDRPEEPGPALHAFRLWSRLMENGKAQFAGEALTDPPDMRRAVWKAYYDTLSIILRRGLLYSGSSDPDKALLGDAEHASEEQYLSARLQQRAELKLVETVYESLLLKETRFPKASESNEEVDAWAESVMSNWRIICGPAWTDEELGEGGKSAVGKGVLDVSGVLRLPFHIKLIVFLDSLPCCDKVVPLDANPTTFICCSRVSSRIRSLLQGVRFLCRDRQQG